MTATSATAVRPVVDSAVAAARHGWAVFPLFRDEKRPGVSDWEHTASADPDYVASNWPRWSTGYGIACGPSGLYVVDCDQPKPESAPRPEWAGDDVRDGLDMLALLAEQAGEVLDFSTFSVETGRGGQHLYYATPDGMDLRNTASDQPNGLGWLIDTRGGGGYIVGPGSVVEGRMYRTVHVERPAPLPQWIVDLLALRKVEAQAASQGAVPRPSSPAAAARPVAGAVGPQWATAALRGELDKLTSHPGSQGGRNHALNAAAFTLGRLVGAGLLNRSAVEDELLAATSGWWGVGSPPFTRTEAEKTISSGLTAGEASPRVPAPREARRRAA